MIKKLLITALFSISLSTYTQDQQSEVLYSVDHSTAHPKQYTEKVITDSTVTKTVKELGHDIGTAGAFVGSYYILSTLHAAVTGNVEGITLSSIGKVALQAVALGASKWLISTGYNNIKKLVSDQ
jgi:hypothetical protein